LMRLSGFPNRFFDDS
jgi:hypothetical protein